MITASGRDQEYYKISSESIPQQSEKSIWNSENNFGFLLGIIAYGIEIHIIELHNLLSSKQFKDQEQTFIDSMFDYYIRPFHKSYNDSESCHTPITASSRNPSRANSAEDSDYVPEEKELSHKDLKKAVVKRDGVCLFCWYQRNLKGSHIIQMNIPTPNDESSFFQRAGLTQQHQVQNAVLLCANCQGEFDWLQRYVDFVDDQLVVKVVNETNDTTSEKHLDWEHDVEALKRSRSFWQGKWADNRQAVESNGETALYFVQTNPTKLPNRKALEFHKTACLIWRMAGGAEIDEEYCSDDDWAPVDTAALKRRFNIQD